MGRWRAAATVLAAFALLTDCAAPPPPRAPHDPSHALPSTGTYLGSLLEAPAAAHPAESGFALVAEGRDAFALRADLAELAERSLDLQYYIWGQDAAGYLLAAQLLAAAKRGVRVRILLDDIHSEVPDEGIVALDAHSNVEVRLFNPFRRDAPRGLQLVIDFQRVNRRMHNKAYIADNAIAVVGGRNISNVYFGLDDDANFRDLDLVAAGPVVGEVSRSFDLFWNSDWSYAVPQVTDAADGEPAHALRRWRQEAGEFPYRLDEDRATLRERMDGLRDRLHWARSAALYDSPTKIEGDGEHTGLRDRIAVGIAEAKSSVLFEVAYFVPTQEDLDLLARLTQRGVRVRLLTNSLATNDIAAAHSGYSKYRSQLLERGVELYELRPDATAPRAGWSLTAGGSTSSLHTKAIAVDRSLVMVGSFNLDPRSYRLNTEMGIAVLSPELGEEVASFIEEGMAPENSFRLELVPRRDGPGERLRWTALDGEGKPIHYWHEPETSWWRRLTSWFGSLLPIEEQL
jgi:putative cardiolipin synthase